MPKLQRGEGGNNRFVNTLRSNVSHGNPRRKEILPRNPADRRSPGQEQPPRHSHAYSPAVTASGRSYLWRFVLYLWTVEIEV